MSNEMTRRRSRSPLRSAVALLAIAVVALTACSVDRLIPGGYTVMRIASFGGTHDDVLQELAAEFERENNVSIEWEPGTATENLAKAAATRINPQFDVILVDDTNQYSASSQGLLAPLDPALVPNAAQLLPVARGANNDAVGYGINPTVLFYNTEIFAQNGWEPPTRWEDLFDPRWCGRVGLPHPNTTYTLHVAQLLGGGKPTDIQAGLARLVELSRCARFEPSSSSLEQKLQLGEYAIGVHGMARIGPLSQKYPVRPVIPASGTLLGPSMMAPVRGAPNPELAQRFINYMLRPDIQEQLVAQLFYSPSISTVTATPQLEGAPTAAQIASWKKADPKLINENRRRWAEQFDRDIG